MSILAEQMNILRNLEKYLYQQRLKGELPRDLWLVCFNAYYNTAETNAKITLRGRKSLKKVLDDYKRQKYNQLELYA